jgi:hypothetical protein
MPISRCGGPDRPNLRPDLPSAKYNSGMDGLWLGGSFVIWVSAGLAVWRVLGRWRSHFVVWPRRTRAFLGIFLFLASGFLLVGGMGMLPPEPRELAELGAGGFAVIALAGSLFVALQTFTAAILVSLVHESVTFGSFKPSNKQISEGNEI